MRPIEFSPEATIKAGLELQATGRNITGFALRQKVGGGNPSRLKQVWDEHLASQSVTRAEPVAELPVEVAEEVALVTKELTQRLAALAVELNDKAVKAAERRVHEVVRSAGEQRAQAERELADASQTVEDLEDGLDKAQAEIEAAAVKLLDLQGVHQAQAVELARVRERLTASELATKTAGELHGVEVQRITTLIEAERSRHAVEVEQLRAEVLSHQKTGQGWAAERDQARSEVMALTAKAVAVEQARQEQRQMVDQEAERVADRLAKAEAAQEQARQDVGVAREEAAKLSGQVEALQTQVAELMRVLPVSKP